ncbi:MULTISPECIES: helix-turn-helix domain-containing protein [unclassified Duganella]|jgi:AraC-like DNA-binding protein|uniref:AraC family transcriptional regulator n=1 Tax=unclassified Duganella TaxID=2636909 RepID=UPI00087E4645|nr:MULTISPECIES: helix-turn-helix domain-containing protein [unclassified Duganella]SDG90191.1 AraC-type DNA-binding protein [Duganella sp. OV458]SDJ52036.1 transcriptional regulator, AraC family [Duganella sp. OV510]
MTTLQSVPRPTRGVVNPAAGEKIFRLERYLPEADLAPFVEHFWLVAWTLPEGVVHVQRTLPSPCIHVVFDAGRTAVFGVMTGAFEYTLRGTGRVLGLRFRPGAFRGFLRQPVQSATDRELPLSAVFACDDAEAEQRVLGAMDDAAMVAAASAIIRTALPPVDPVTARIAEILQAIEHNADITQVQQLADHVGISVRKLQMLFKDYVGATPKWVIRRNRLLDASDLLAKGSEVDLAALAQQLGYYDQSHFTTDFEKLVGKPPADYRRSCKEPT